MIFEDVGVASTRGFAFDYTDGGACVHVPPSCMGGETSLMLGQRGGRGGGDLERMLGWVVVVTSLTPKC